ncbi:MAG TPA: multidrug transporter [Stellaceae bacterium]|nr:multidrug transporter [Stellaceae bacterium]
MLFNYLALAAAILLGVLGQILLKSGALRSSGMVAQILDPLTVVGLGIYFAASICYIIAIRKLPLSLAFPSVSASYIVVALIAHFAWGETLGLAQLAGIALIAGGILMLHQ